MHDLLEHPLLRGLGDDRRWGVGAHAAGVLSPVAVQCALVVLGRRQRHHPLAVADRVVGRLLPLEQVLDHHPLPGRPEAPLAHHLVERPLGQGRARADADALAGRQAIGLHHAGTAPLADVRARRLQIVEAAESGVGNPVAGHELPGEGLAALETRHLPGRTEDGHAGLPQAVGHTVGEGILGTDHDQVDALFERRGGSDPRRHRPRPGEPGWPALPSRHCREPRRPVRRGGSARSSRPARALAPPNLRQAHASMGGLQLP